MLTQQLSTDIVSLPNAPALPGLIFRRFRGQDDYARMAAVLQAAHAADRIDEYISTEELTADFKNLTSFDHAHDLLIAEGHGGIIAYSGVHSYQEDDGAHVYSFFGGVHPGWQRKGIGRAILRHTERRVKEIAAALPKDAPRFLQSFAYDTQPGADALLRQEGYQVARRAFTMVRPDLDNLPDAPLPSGLEVRPARSEHFRAIWEAKEEVFRDHWGHRAPSEDKYREWLNDLYFDPALWQVAWEIDVDQVVGTTFGFVIPEENERFDRRRGYIQGIAVRRAWRKRGLATALLVGCLRLLKARGLGQATLYVDTENPSGAVGLYERAGFRVVRREGTYRKPLDGG